MRRSELSLPKMKLYMLRFDRLGKGSILPRPFGLGWLLAHVLIYALLPGIVKQMPAFWRHLDKSDRTGENHKDYREVTGAPLTSLTEKDHEEIHYPDNLHTKLI